MSTPQTTPQRDEFLWKQAKKRVGFKLHLRSFLIVNAGLWLIYLVQTIGSTGDLNFTGRHFPWPLFAMIGWGIGLTSHYFSVYNQSGERDMAEREYQKLMNEQR
ncbi:MAG: 2TM domain-containing protein [Spirosoma sp.]|nr:2TM domain-containing protein [Spirosoma sp.]